MNELIQRHFLKMTRTVICLILLSNAFANDHTYEKEIKKIEQQKELKKAELSKYYKKNPDKRIPKYYYSYFNRRHTAKETLKHIGVIYGLTWALYPVTQPETFREKGSFKNYGKNFGELVFDKDEPFWNWIVHPISGSQLYLYYRANGYSMINSLALTFVSSTLFEFTVEVYTEPASIQDLYQTPIIGSIIGLGLEKFSLYLLNTGNIIGRFFGHLLNPATLFWFYEGKMKLTPYVDHKKNVGLNLNWSF